MKKLIHFSFLLIVILIFFGLFGYRHYANAALPCPGIVVQSICYVEAGQACGFFNCDPAISYPISNGAHLACINSVCKFQYSAYNFSSQNQGLTGAACTPQTNGTSQCRQGLVCRTDLSIQPICEYPPTQCNNNKSPDGSTCHCNADCSSNNCSITSNATGTCASGSNNNNSTPTSTPTPTPISTSSQTQAGNCDSATNKPGGCSCYLASVCASGQCIGAYNVGDFYISPTPGSCASVPTPSPTPNGSATTTGACIPGTNIQSVTLAQYGLAGCPSGFSTAATFTCTDGSTMDTSVGYCQNQTQWTNMIMSNGSCANHGNTCPPPTPTPKVLTCDPVKDGLINKLDYSLWFEEYTGAKTSNYTACFHPGDNTVNLLDFQAWRDITITKVLQPF